MSISNDIEWYSKGEEADEEVLNRPLKHIVKFLDENMFIVDTIDDLRNMEETPPTVRVRGYYDKDGGEFGSHYYKKVDSGTDNGGTIIKAKNATYYLQFDNYIDVRWFGAKGNGADDDTVAFNNAVKASRGAKLFGSNLTYVINEKVTYDFGVTIEDFIFNCTNNDNEVVIEFEGSEGTYDDLTENVLEGGTTIKLDDTTKYSPDDYLYIKSDKVVNDDNTLGCMVHVKDVTDEELILYEPLLYSFYTDDSARVSKLDLLKGVELKNVKAIGRGDTEDTQSFVRLYLCKDVIVNKIHTKYFSNAGISLYRCLNPIVTNSTFDYSRLAGFAYGVVVEHGCYGANINNNYGTDVRHLVTIGGSEGINLFTKITNNTARTKEAGIDSHEMSDYTTIADNMIEIAKITSNTSIGIMFQGNNPTIVNNTIIGATQLGIMVQTLTTLKNSQMLIEGNNLYSKNGSDATDVGIYVQLLNEDITKIEAINICNNTISYKIKEYGIYIKAISGTAKNINISNNNISYTDKNSIFIQSTSSDAYMYGVSITGNMIRGGGNNYEGIYIQGVNNIYYGSIIGNTVLGYKTGIRYYKCHDFIERGNNIPNLYPYSIDDDSYNLSLDDAHAVTITVKNSDYTVKPWYRTLISSRGEESTLHLPPASQIPGAEIRVKCVQEYAIKSADENIVNMNGDTTDEILEGEKGTYCVLKSDGNDKWVMVEK